jgi:hypothetical protein
MERGDSPPFVRARDGQKARFRLISRVFPDVSKELNFCAEGPRTDSHAFLQLSLAKTQRRIENSSQCRVHRAHTNAIRPLIDRNSLSEQMLDFTDHELEIIKVLTPIIQTVIAVFGFVSAMVQFNSSLKQRRDDQLWKQNEFVAAKFKDFFDDFNVRNALQMLDWRKRKICLWKNDQSKAVIVDHVKLMDSLKTKDKFNPEEALIRDTFDEFFTKLGYFENYISAGVVSKCQLEPYLAYWMDLLHAKKPRIMSAEIVEGIWNFLEAHDFKDTITLLLRFGDRPKASP